MSDRKPIGLSTPYRSAEQHRVALERQVAELEARVRQLEAIVRKLDRENLTRRK
jgi:cell division protein FtsB